MQHWVTLARKHAPTNRRLVRLKVPKNGTARCATNNLARGDADDEQYRRSRVSNCGIGVELLEQVLARLRSPDRGSLATKAAFESDTIFRIVFNGRDRSSVLCLHRLDRSHELPFLTLPPFWGRPTVSSSWRRPLRHVQRSASSCNRPSPV